MLPQFIAIAACDPHGTMGLQGSLPWEEPEDIEHFRRSVKGEVMVMGYKTYRAMPASVLHESINLIFTKNHAEDVLQGTPIFDLEALCVFYATHPELLLRKNFVIGGAEIFTLFFEEGLISRAIITHINKQYAGDVFFPLHFLTSWKKSPISWTKTFSIVDYIK